MIEFVFYLTPSRNLQPKNVSNSFNPFLNTLKLNNSNAQIISYSKPKIDNLYININNISCKSN